MVDGAHGVNGRHVLSLAVVVIAGGHVNVTTRYRITGVINAMEILKKQRHVIHNIVLVSINTQYCTGEY